MVGRIKTGMRENAKAGNFNGGIAPYGYRLKTKENGRQTLEINEKEAEAVKIIFDMFINKSTNADICEHLNNLGMSNLRDEWSNLELPRTVRPYASC